MSCPAGFPSQEKLNTPLVGYSQQLSKTTSEYQTYAITHDKKVTSDVKAHGFFRTTTLAQTLTSVDAQYPLRVLKCTGHGAERGDFIRFELASANPYFSALVIEVPDADTLIIGSTLNALPVTGDEFFVLKTVVPRYSADGGLSVSSGPIEFVLDGNPQQVTEDTVTPANSAPLPVKLLDTDFATETTLLAVLAQVSAGKEWVTSARIDYSSTNVDNSTWTELLADTGADQIETITLFDAGGFTMELGIGASSSEVRALLIPPGGFNGQFKFVIPPNSRLSVRAVGAALVDAGEITLNLFK